MYNNFDERDVIARGGIGGGAKGILIGGALAAVGTVGGILFKKKLEAKKAKEQAAIEFVEAHAEDCD